MTLDSSVNPQINTDLYLHVRVMLGIILGLSVTRLVGGIAGIIQGARREHLPWIHLGWVAWALLNVIPSGGGTSG